MSLKPMAMSHAAKPLKSSESLSASQDDHLSSLKALTEKLKLETSKPSYLDWRAQLEAMLAQSHRVSDALAAPGDTEKQKTSGPLKWTKPSLGAGVIHEGRQPSVNRLGFGSIDRALEWLRKELAEMRLQDQQLARQLMHLRSDINKQRIVQTCNQHRKMLNDATFELEERDDMSDLCDVPMSPGLGLSSTLKVIGVTKMNINSRRFSLC
ncbi:protein FAM167A [Ctenopharyngodon idella]|uniref:protein FAM167A n=1 Tax=Ctenopharyngodon idella TaxID=7959 RepID=UPI00222E6A4F|nr:protein FAM167A [Ctenopharyngodon idella]XP_051724406.1 protein FAM167A [Ctenopharyngodon idella]